MIADRLKNGKRAELLEVDGRIYIEGTGLLIDFDKRTVWFESPVGSMRLCSTNAAIDPHGSLHIDTGSLLIPINIGQ